MRPPRRTYDPLSVGASSPPAAVIRYSSGHRTSTLVSVLALVAVIVVGLILFLPQPETMSEEQMAALNITRKTGISHLRTGPADVLWTKDGHWGLQIETSGGLLVHLIQKSPAHRRKYASFQLVPLGNEAILSGIGNFQRSIPWKRPENATFSNHGKAYLRLLGLDVLENLEFVGENLQKQYAGHGEPKKMEENGKEYAVFEQQVVIADLVRSVQWLFSRLHDVEQRCHCTGS